MSKANIILERRFVPKGKMVLRQGDQGNCAYLVQSGSVTVFVEEEGRTTNLATLGVGEIFGEMALIFDETRSASIKTAEDSNLIVITRNEFKTKLQRTDPTIKAVMEMLSKRISGINKELIAKKSSVEDLTDSARHIYENVYNGLPDSQQQAFQNNVLPKLDEFLNAVGAFYERYKKDEK